VTRPGSARWYRGDLHSHSTVSDGVLAPEALLEEAEREGLDFFAITDHNRWAYPWFPRGSSVLVIAGIEVTTPYGHFNVFAEGSSEPPWLSLLPDVGGETREEPQPGAARELLSEVRASGLRGSINHPRISPWAWWDPELDLASISYLEVWNDPTWPENREANPATLEMWTRWLNAGLRVTAVGGSDFHDPEPKRRRDGRRTEGHRIGIPRTYVFAEACTPAAILRALDGGRAYVTMGPTIELHGATEEAEVGIGDDLGMSGGPLEVEASARGGGSVRLELIRNGQPAAIAEGSGGAGLRMTFELEPGEPGWLRVDVRDARGEVVAFSNPIFHGPRPDPPSRRYGDFTDMTPLGRGAPLEVVGVGRRRTDAAGRYEGMEGKQEG
jgi:hypothetical protein